MIDTKEQKDYIVSLRKDIQEYLQKTIGVWAWSYHPIWPFREYYVLFDCPLCGLKGARSQGTSPFVSIFFDTPKKEAEVICQWCGGKSVIKVEWKGDDEARVEGAGYDARYDLHP